MKMLAILEVFALICVISIFIIMDKDNRAPTISGTGTAVATFVGPAMPSISGTGTAVATFVGPAVPAWSGGPNSVGIGPVKW
jgi:hypothetical protein